MHSLVAANVSVTALSHSRSIAPQLRMYWMSRSKLLPIFLCPPEFGLVVLHSVRRHTKRSVIANKKYYWLSHHVAVKLYTVSARLRWNIFHLRYWRPLPRHINKLSSVSPNSETQTKAKRKSGINFGAQIAHFMHHIRSGISHLAYTRGHTNAAHQIRNDLCSIVAISLFLRHAFWIKKNRNKTGTRNVLESWCMLRGRLPVKMSMKK